MWQSNRFCKNKVSLFLIAVFAGALWAQIGRAQGPCFVGRGQDPLDILNTSVRHNVWIILDTSGSMRGDFQGTTKIKAAKAVLTRLLQELEDAGGNPLVNWGFVHYDQNVRDETSECAEQFKNSCVGLATACDGCSPPSCFGTDNRDKILADLKDLSPGGWTPNGISLDHLSTGIVNNGFVTNLLPKQRNFIIIVTDGDDTCECSTKAWDTGTTPVALRGDDTDPTPFGSFSGSGDVRAYNAGLKGKLAYERLNPSAQDRATGAKGGVFVIGMGLGSGSRRRANHLAWEASGTSYGNPDALSALFADNEEELLQRLRDALARVGVVDTRVNLGTSLVGSVKELIPQIDGINTVTPNDVLATGELDSINPARSLRASLKNNVVFATSVETKGFRGHLTATNSYRVDGFQTDDEVRSTDTRPLEDRQFWDAGELLRDRDPDNRTILFNTRRAPFSTIPGELRVEEEGGPLSNDALADLLGVDRHYLKELDPTGEGARTKADAARIVVQVVRGYRLVIDPVNGIYNAKGDLNFSTVEENGEGVWKLLDPTNAGPAVVLNPPRSPDADPPRHHADEYGLSFPNGFYWDHLNRQTVVCIGTNGGLLHCFRADNGAELFAYVPPDILGDWSAGETPASRNTLKDLVPLIVSDNNGIQNHRFFIASSASVEDVFLQTDKQWHTALAFGRGRGGKFITALDLSNLPDWDGNVNNIDDRLDPADTNRLPKLLFNVGNRQGKDDDLYDGFGETWSVPVMGNVVAPSPLDDRWVMFVGAGYGCSDQKTNEGQYLFVLAMEDGSVIKRYSIGNDASAPIPYNALVAMPALYNPHLFDPDRLDDKDYTTRVYIGDLQGKVHKLDTYHPDPDKWVFKQLYDVGGDEPGLDQPITAAAALTRVRGDGSVYVSVGTGGDLRVDDPATLFKFLTIHDMAAEGAFTPGQLLWELELDPTWRVIVSPVVGGNQVFFGATRVESDTTGCTLQFFSRLQSLNISSGLGVFDLDTDTGTVDNPLDLGQGKVTGLFFRGEHLYVSKSGSIDVEGETLVMGREQWKPEETQAAGTIQLFVRGFRLSPF